MGLSTATNSLEKDEAIGMLEDDVEQQTIAPQDYAAASKPGVAIDDKERDYHNEAIGSRNKAMRTLFVFDLLLRIAFGKARAIILT